VQQDTLQFVHRVKDVENAVEIFPGVFWGGNFEAISLMIETQQIAPDEIKFFLGYSGWTAGQLNDELKDNTWIVSDQVDMELIFETEPEDMWQCALKLMGGRFSIYSNYPVDPRMN
jgi:putative transcriptional regulator